MMDNYDKVRSTATSKLEGRLKESVSGLAKKKKKKDNSYLIGVIKKTSKKEDGKGGCGSKSKKY